MFVLDVTQLCCATVVVLLHAISSFHLMSSFCFTQSLLRDEQIMQAPVLILGNKIDIPGAASEDEIRAVFNLHGQTTGKVCLVFTCVIHTFMCRCGFSLPSPPLSLYIYIYMCVCVCACILQIVLVQITVFPNINHDLYIFNGSYFRVLFPAVNFIPVPWNCSCVVC